MVPIYHKGLSNPDIMEMTCTDETSLEEEYQNQKSYKDAGSEKLIFLVVDL